jgi:hypothetical protein
LIIIGVILPVIGLVAKIVILSAIGTIVLVVGMSLAQNRVAV